MITKDFDKRTVPLAISPFNINGASSIRLIVTPTTRTSYATSSSDVESRSFADDMLGER